MTNPPPCLPRFATKRDPSRFSLGPALGQLAAKLGHPFMPWQQLVADIGLEIDPVTGHFVYRDITFLTPRQSGKTTLLLTWALHRLLTDPGCDTVYSAQDGQAARAKLLHDLWPILAPHKKALGVSRILRSNGNEAIEMVNLSRLTPMSSADDALHGRTISFAIRDELFADTDNRREGAITPAMSTISNGQVLTASTAGTDQSIPLNLLIERGRANCLAGLNHTSAYFEWSAPEDADPDDEDVWWRCMPALGHTIDLPVIRHARATMSDGEFRRAYLNQTTHGTTVLIPAAKWDAVQAPGAQADSEPRTFGLDVNPERNGWSVVAFDSARVVEVVEHSQDVSRLVARVAELDAKYRPTWAVDGRSSAPIAALLPDLERAGVKVTKVTSEYPAACASLLDAITQGSIKVRSSDALNQSVTAVSRRLVGDGFTWTRRSSVDISPIIAATLALWVPAKAKRRNVIF